MSDEHINSSSEDFCAAVGRAIESRDETIASLTKMSKDRLERIHRLEGALRDCVMAIEKLRNLIRHDGHTGQHAFDSCEYCGRQHLGELALAAAKAALEGGK